MSIQPVFAVLSAGTLVGGIAAAWVLAIALLAWRRLAGAAAAALMGAGVAAYLTLQHSPASGSSFCTVNAVIDCDAVNRSAWSELFGIPIALLGFGFYVAVLAVLALGRLRRDDHPRAPHLLVLGGGAAVLYSAVLAGVSAHMGKWCLLCVSMYGFNTLILVAGLLAARRSDASLGAGLAELLRGKTDKSLGAFATAGVLAVVVGLFVYGRAGGTAAADAGSDDLASLYKATEGPLELDGTEPILGRKDAPYTVVEFADFQCPACAAATPQVFEMVQADPDIRVLYKNFPISSVCNRLIEGPRHARACPAAYAGECARQQGRFWQLEKLMFANQEFLGDDDIRFMAKQAGLDLDAFETCLADPRTREAIAADVDASEKVGVHFTPSFFVQGLFPDGRWVLVEEGPVAIRRLVEAHRAGAELPPPPAR